MPSNCHNKESTWFPRRLPTVRRWELWTSFTMNSLEALFHGLAGTKLQGSNSICRWNLWLCPPSSSASSPAVLSSDGLLSSSLSSSHFSFWVLPHLSTLWTLECSRILFYCLDSLFKEALLSCLKLHGLMIPSLGSPASTSAWSLELLHLQPP